MAIGEYIHHERNDHYIATDLSTTDINNTLLPYHAIDKKTEILERNLKVMLKDNSLNCPHEPIIP